MLKYQIMVGGKHSAVIEIGEGQSFTGSIVTEDFGQGTVSGTRDGPSLSGSMYLDGHHARFTASLGDNSISGSIRAFLFAEDFSGTQIVPGPA